jgi:hypothetical protein
MRVCQFRHFGTWTKTFARQPNGCLSGRTTVHFTDASRPVKLQPRSDKPTRTSRKNLYQPVSLLHPPGTTYNLLETPGPASSRETHMPNAQKLPPEIVSRLRMLAHDLSNSIETIMQASYLLSQLKHESDGAKWVSLIEDAAQDAAHVNREIREVLRTQT